MSLPRLSILHWTSSPFSVDKMGGIEVMEQRWLGYFRNQHFSADLYVPQVLNSTGKNLENVHALHHVKRLVKYDVFYYVQFLWRARRSQRYLASNAPFLAVFAPKKTVVFFHNFIVSGGKQSFLPLYSLFKKRYRKAEMVFCSQFLRDEFTKLYPDFPTGLLHVVFNSIPSEDVVKRNKPFGEAKKIAFVGQWNYDKGVDVLLEAMQIVRKSRDDFSVSLVGSSTLWNNSGSDSEKYMTDLPYVCNKGVLPRKELIPFMQSCDILVVPSRWKEPFGLVAIEGLASGLIVISSGQGGLRDSVVNQMNGIEFKSGLAIDLARAISAALQLTIDEQQRLRNNGYRIVKEKFDLQKNMQLFTQLLFKKQ